MIVNGLEDEITHAVKPERCIFATNRFFRGSEMQFCHISGFSSFWAVLSVTGHLSGLEIKSHKHAARLIPHDEFSPDIVLYLAKDPSLLRYIPEYKMTEEAAYEAVSHSLLMEDGVKLAYIPERLLTKKVCERAFETNMDAL